MEEIKEQELTTDVETSESSPKKNYFAWWTNSTLATKVTFARLAMIPFIIFFYIGANEFTASDFFFYWGKIVALIIFIVAVATDYLDGYLARKRNEVSDVGKLLDPIADKLLAFTAFALIVTDTRLLASDPDGFLPGFAAALIILIPISRDLIVGIIRQLAATKGIVMAADKIAKAKTMLMFLSLTLFMIYAANFNFSSTATHTPFLGTDLFFDMFRYIAWFFMIVTMALTVISCVNYIIKYNKAQKELIETQAAE
ncbi:MAG: CDP-alcohol phosphatidyltransferase family protein [Firmicutes bacterium]|nr:CDP-alcohol phosphatidyltransferase family protein [Bacillota bacterium]